MPIEIPNFELLQGGITLISIPIGMAQCSLDMYVCSEDFRSETMRAALPIMGKTPMRGQSLVLLGHVRHALWVQFLDKRFHGATEGVEWMLHAVLFKQPQHAINIGGTSHIHGIFGQFIHGGEIACEPVAVGEIETIAPGLEKGLTRF